MIKAATAAAQAKKKQPRSFILMGKKKWVFHDEMYGTYVTSGSLLQESRLVMSLDLLISSSWFLDDRLCALLLLLLGCFFKRKREKKEEFNNQ
jgi:hypothetical protein